MSNINNQTQDLFAPCPVQDLDHQSAAAIQGGIQLYTDANFEGFLLPTEAVSDLSQVSSGFFNDQTSSIFNDTNKVWKFYTDANYEGSVLTLKPGTGSANLAGTPFQDSISSYKSV